jgi:hypothetical protein
MRTDNAEAISGRLNYDPWTNLKLLRIVSITPWTLRLGGIPDAA